MGRGYRRICIAYLLGSSVEAPKIGNLQRALKVPMKKLAETSSQERPPCPVTSLHLLLKTMCFFFRRGASLLPWLSLLGKRGLPYSAAVRGPCGGLSVAEHRLLGLRASEARGVSVAAPTSSVALRQAAYSQVRDRAHISYTGRWILSMRPPGKSSPPYSANVGVRWEATAETEPSWTMSFTTCLKLVL